MDEKKKQYLESLRKQLDPDVLSKMADYLGGGEERGPALRVTADQKAAAFQERVRSRKREQQLQEIFVREKSTHWLGDHVLIYSRNSIWTKILEKTFRNLKFRESRFFASFAELISYTMKGLNDGSLGRFAIAVGTRDIPDFIINWENLRRADFNENLKRLLDKVPLFFVVEHVMDADEGLARHYGPESVIVATQRPEKNLPKVETVLCRADERSG